MEHQDLGVVDRSGGGGSGMLSAMIQQSVSQIRPSYPTMPRRRVLLSAFVASAQGGSEVAIGWNLARALVAFHDITLLCTPYTGVEDFRKRNDAFFDKHGPIPGLSLHYVEPPLLSRWFQQGHMGLRKPLYYIGYASWQWAALKQARKLHQQKAFDIAHHLNITGFREPGYLWLLDIPFVWGPIGGAADFPARYFPLLNLRDQFQYRLRNMVNRWQRTLAWRPRQAAKKAGKIWTIGPENYRMVTEQWGIPAEMLCESGASSIEINPERTVYNRQRPIRLVWSGLFIGRKALPLFLHALARLPESVEWEATIIGDGPGRNSSHALASRLNLQPRIRWTGSLHHTDALQELGLGDVLIFTSLQEGTPVTLLEALSRGLPVVCHNTCGMGVAITPDCGVLIQPDTIESSIRGFAQAITRLANDPVYLQRLSQGALHRAEQLSWDRIAQKIAYGYEQVILATGGKG